MKFISALLTVCGLVAAVLGHAFDPLCRGFIPAFGSAPGKFLLLFPLLSG
jgi:hypothetical protein